jgi:F0F1-type ATP synthase assembly protein I
MALSIFQKTRKGLYHLLLLQLSVMLFISVGLSVWKFFYGYSAFVGGLISWVTTAYFGYRFFAYQGAQQTKKIIQAMYWAEGTKFILAFVLFYFSIKYCHTNALFLIVGYCCVQSVFWLTPWLFLRANQR